jgi:hypothetical protein
MVHTIRLAVLCPLLSNLAVCQTAPQRSEELCSALQSTASEKGRQFAVDRPGACMINIDTGYNLFVNYSERRLFVSLGIWAGLLNGDSSAFLLRLSAFDNLAHVAMGTDQQAVFDEMNKLTKKWAHEQLQHGPNDKAMHSTIRKVLLGARAYPASNTIMLMASADVKDIDRMKSQARPT